MSHRAIHTTAAVGVAALLAAAPALAATTTSRSISSPRAGVAISGVPTAVATWKTTLSFPSTWSVVGKPSTSMKLRVARNDLCQYTVTVRNEVVAAPSDASPAARAAEVVPGTGRYVVDSGTRNSAAWRVVRKPTTGGVVRLDAVRVIRHYTDAKAGLPAGQAGWLQTRVTAVSDQGDECHAGTWRDTVGPGIGDALSTERSSAYTRPKAD